LQKQNLGQVKNYKLTSAFVERGTQFRIKNRRTSLFVFEEEDSVGTREKSLEGNRKGSAGRCANARVRSGRVSDNRESQGRPCGRPSFIVWLAVKTGKKNEEGPLISEPLGVNTRREGNRKTERSYSADHREEGGPSKIRLKTAGGQGD